MGEGFSYFKKVCSILLALTDKNTFIPFMKRIKGESLFGFLPAFNIVQQIYMDLFPRISFLEAS